MSVVVTGGSSDWICDLGRCQLVTPFAGTTSFEGEIDDPVFMLSPAGYSRGTLEMLPLLITDFSHLPEVYIDC